MATQLPTLVGTHCIYVQACGLLTGTPDKATPPPTEPIVARQRRDGGYQYIRLLQMGEPVSHIHVDIAHKAYFGTFLPSISHKMADVNKAMASYSGSAVDLYFRAMYLVPVASLPPSGLILAGQNRVLTKFEGAEVELSGAVLKLSNAPVDSIEWQTVEHAVFVDIIFRRPATISDSYISDSLEITNAAINTFVLGKAASPRP